MTAGVVYLKIPDSESLLALLVPRASEAVPTLWDINVFYRSVREEFLRTPFFRKKEKTPLLSPSPFSPHFVCSGFVCGMLLGISNEKGKNGGAGVLGSPPAPTAQPGQGAQVRPGPHAGRFGHADMRGMGRKRLVLDT